jgi:hypothetical protein
MPTCVECLEVGEKGCVDLADDVALEPSDDLVLDEPLLGASVDVLAGAGVVAHAAEHDRVEGVVGGVVSATVETVAVFAAAELVGMGATPQRWARAAALRSRSGLSPAVVSSWPATSGPTPSRAMSVGAVLPPAVAAACLPGRPPRRGAARAGRWPRSAALVAWTCSCGSANRDWLSAHHLVRDLEMPHHDAAGFSASPATLFGMLARSVIRVPLPGRPAWLPSGYAVLDESGRQLLVSDRTLAPVARIPVPIGDGRLDAAVSVDGSLAAFGSLDRTVVTAADGTIHWQRESVIKPQGLPQKPAVHIDRPGACGSMCQTGTTLPCSTPRPGTRSTAQN